MSLLLDVIKVEALENYTLLLQFENGEQRRFDMSPYIDRKPWVKLKNSPLFFLAKVEYGTVVWPGEIDIDPETLYELSEPISSESSSPIQESDITTVGKEIGRYWRVVEAKVLEHGRFCVKFADDLEGTVRMKPSAFRGVFQKLTDPAFFTQMYVNDYFVTWPGELDLAPDAMYSHIKDKGEWILE